MDFTNIPTAKIEEALEEAKIKGDVPNALLFEAELAKRNKAKASETGLREQGLSGLYEGLASGLGAPVDIVTAGLNKLGMDIEKPFGGSESIKSGLQAISGGRAITDVPPQDAPQRILRGTGEVFGETIPAAATLATVGPKAAITAAPTAWNAFKNALASVRGEAAAAPATFAATEAATAVGGGLAESSVAELFPENPTAQMIANILGAVAGGKTAEIPERLLRPKATGPLTSDELKSEAGRLYEIQKSEGLSAQPDVTDKIFGDVFSFLDQSGYLTAVRGSNQVRVAPDYAKLRPVVNMLEAYADKGMTAARIQTMRRSIAARMRDTTGEEKNALRNVLRIFDENTATLAPQIKVANAMYSRAMKAEQVEELLELAKTRATSANLDMENAIRTEFRQLARNIIKGREVGWSQDEINQINQIVEGGSAENIARFIGKFAPTGVVSAGLGGGVPYGLAYNVTGDPLASGAVAAGVLTTGQLGKTAGGLLQKQNVNELYQSIVQGRNMTPEAQRKLYSALTAYFGGQAVTQ